MTPDFQTLQRQFAAYIRNPLTAELPPGCDARRMRHYHHLFLNNFDGVLEAVFERLRSSLSDTDWSGLTRRFFQTVPQHSPYFADVPTRFIEFLDEQTEVPLTDGQNELAAYELACFELKTDKDAPLPDELTPNDDGLAAFPVLNPDSLLFESLYPVHDVAWNPHDPAQLPTFLILVRDHTGAVQTHEISAVSARLLQLIHQHPEFTGAESISALAQELNQPVASLQPFALKQLAQWRDDQVLLGTRPRPRP
ncbi:MAG: HvfC family RiPP maturation protein [Halothiobacillus sp.]